MNKLPPKYLLWTPGAQGKCHTETAMKQLWRSPRPDTGQDCCSSDPFSARQSWVDGADLLPPGPEDCHGVYQVVASEVIHSPPPLAVTQLTAATVSHTDVCS